MSSNDLKEKITPKARLIASCNELFAIVKLIETERSTSVKDRELKGKVDAHAWYLQQLKIHDGLLKILNHDAKKTYTTNFLQNSIGLKIVLEFAKFKKDLPEDTYRKLNEIVDEFAFDALKENFFEYDKAFTAEKFMPFTLLDNISELISATLQAITHEKSSIVSQFFAPKLPVTISGVALEVQNLLKKAVESLKNDKTKWEEWSKEDLARLSSQIAKVQNTLNLPGNQLALKTLMVSSETMYSRLNAILESFKAKILEVKRPPAPSYTSF